MSSSSQQTVKSDTLLDDNTFPSPISSIRSKSTSQRSSTRSSPMPEEATTKRRRSHRISEHESLLAKEKAIQQAKEKEAKEKAKISKSSKDEADEEPKLVLKKRKLETNGKTKLQHEDVETDPKKKPKRQAKITVQNGKLKFFEEPELADPIMSVTGLPLEAPPNSKIKKESLWPKKKGKKTNKQATNGTDEADEDPNTTPDISLPPEEIEQKLRNELKTNEHLKILKESDSRSHIVKPIPKPGADKTVKKKQKVKEQPSSVTSTPKKPKQKDGKRKVKNSSPKKLRENPFGYDDPTQLAGQHRENAFDFNDNTKDNEDFCASCGEPGIFLCCESCPKSFHFACCSPPLDEDSLPDGEWYCNECKSKKRPPAPNPPGLFAKLLNAVDTRNPIQFQLPKRLRERFEGVVTGKFGEYEDTDYKPYRPTKIGSFEQTDPDLHFDKDGNILYCKKCGESGISSNKLNGVPDKLIATCDYCPSAWHLDCLDPPLSSAKQLGTKWKCPNHADHLLPDRQRRLRRPNIIDVDQVHGFKNNGDIEVKLKEEDEDDDEDDTSMIHEIPTPAYMNNRDTKSGISAEIPKNTMKLWNDSYAIYRIPEEGILSDFTAKVLDMREKQKQERITETWKLTRENNILLKDILNGDDYNAEEKETVGSLIKLPEINFRDLASVAAAELGKLDGETNYNDTANLTKDEIEDLVHIKKLIAMKGKDELLRFLKS